MHPISFSQPHEIQGTNPMGEHGLDMLPQTCWLNLWYTNKWHAERANQSNCLQSAQPNLYKKAAPNGTSSHMFLS
eukprot:6486245-Amphidinium_carterae.1